MRCLAPLDREQLRRAIANGAAFDFIPFYGHTAEPGHVTDAVYSQCYPASFEIEGIAFRWAEQWLMACKGTLFRDAETRAAISEATEPRECNALGRAVRDYDDATWAAARFDYVVQGNVAKFGQNAALRDHLLASGDAILVEAAPRDRIWGIGLVQENPAVRDPTLWRGQNRLGFALVKVRAILWNEIAIA